MLTLWFVLLLRTPSTSKIRKIITWSFQDLVNFPAALILHWIRNTCCGGRGAGFGAGNTTGHGTLASTYIFSSSRSDR